MLVSLFQLHPQEAPQSLNSSHPYSFCEALVLPRPTGRDHGYQLSSRPSGLTTPSLSLAPNLVGAL